jgi:outer membrane protein assembly factor BamB
MGAIALVDDSRIAVRSANKMWRLDVETGQTISVQEMFLGNTGRDADASAVSVHSWQGDDIITSVASRDFGDSEESWALKTQVSVFSPSAMPNAPTLTTNSGDEFPEHIPLSPVISRPSSGQVFAREMVNKEDPEDIVRSFAVKESANRNFSWKTKLARSAPEPSDEVSRTQLVGASQSKLFLFAGYGETEDHLFGAVSIQDGDLLWARKVSELPVPYMNVLLPDVAIDPQGRPVFGYGNGLIAFDHDGTVRWTKDMPGQRFVAQQTMAMDSDGTLYVVSLSDKHRIRAFDTQGNQLFKTSLPDGWREPQLLAMGKNGMLILEALKVEYVFPNDRGKITSRIFALGDR